MSEETPWRAGRFDARGGAQKILFGRMYEDVAIERAVFPAAARLFCIASAGCTALELATYHHVTAVDINPVQLAYAEQRAAGAPPRAGVAERVMNFGRRLAPLVGWRRSVLTSFLALEQPDDQMTFWNRRLNTARFRIGTEVLFSPAVLRLMYASPFLTVLPPDFGRVLRARLERCWRMHPNRTNLYARALLLGEAPPIFPPAAREPIRFVCADAAAFLESCVPNSFDGFTLSNILDGAPTGYRERLRRAIRHAATVDGLVVLRSFAEPKHASASNQAAQDRAMLWGSVAVRSVHTPDALTL
jgi:hypothetical protein